MDKTCSTCGETKPATEFWRKSSGKNGLQGSCKSCTDLAHRAGLLRPPRYPAPEGMKRCSACKEIKQVAEFPNNKRYFDGLHIVCKTCHYKRHAVYRQSANNRAKIEATNRKRMHKPVVKEAHYNQKIRRKYSLPLSWTYAEMLASQNGGCAICGTDDNPGMFHLAVDHDKATGAIRGLLCTNCNNALGQFRDSSELLRKAADYLENPPAPQFLASLSTET